MFLWGLPTFSVLSTKCMRSCMMQMWNSRVYCLTSVRALLSIHELKFVCLSVDCMFCSIHLIFSLCMFDMDFVTPMLVLFDRAWTSSLSVPH